VNGLANTLVWMMTGQDYTVDVTTSAANKKAFLTIIMPLAANKLIDFLADYVFIPAQTRPTNGRKVSARTIAEAMYRLPIWYSQVAGQAVEQATTSSQRVKRPPFKGEQIRCGYFVIDMPPEEERQYIDQKASHDQGGVIEAMTSKHKREKKPMAVKYIKKSMSGSIRPGNDLAKQLLRLLQRPWVVKVFVRRR
jgi:hypothetical protein